jgi:type VI protein secretion system component VasF
MARRCKNAAPRRAAKAAKMPRRAAPRTLQDATAPLQPMAQSLAEEMDNRNVKPITNRKL